MVHAAEIIGGSAHWTVFVFLWPYLCLPVSYTVDGMLRKRWVLDEVSRPATGYRFKGANLQMVLTSRTAPKTESYQGSGTDSAGQEQSRRVDCTNLWPVTAVFTAIFVCAAEWASGPLSILLVCIPFLLLTIFALTLGQVIIFVSLLASPVVHVIYGVINRGPGNKGVSTLLWSQTFIVFTAVSLAWTIRDMKTLQSMVRTRLIPNRTELETQETQQETSAPEICIIQAAEALLEGRPGCQSDEEKLVEKLPSMVQEAWSHNLPIDTPVLQTMQALQAWRRVIRHEMEVEVHIREADRWGALGEKLISMNAGMPFMVGIVQGVILAVSWLEGTSFSGSGSSEPEFYASIGAYAVSMAAATVLLVRILALIHGAVDGLAVAAGKTESAMDAFEHFRRSWSVSDRGEIGCLTHIAARKGMVRVLGYLLRNGANPSSIDSAGQTPLDVAKEARMDIARDFLVSFAAGSQVTSSSAPEAGKVDHGAKPGQDPSGDGKGKTSDEPRDPGDEQLKRKPGWGRVRGIGRIVGHFVRERRASLRGKPEITSAVDSASTVEQTAADVRRQGAPACGAPVSGPAPSSQASGAHKGDRNCPGSDRHVGSLDLAECGKLDSGLRERVAASAGDRASKDGVDGGSQGQTGGSSSAKVEKIVDSATEVRPFRAGEARGDATRVASCTSDGAGGQYSGVSRRAFDGGGVVGDKPNAAAAAAPIPVLVRPKSAFGGADPPDGRKACPGVPPPSAKPMSAESALPRGDQVKGGVSTPADAVRAGRRLSTRVLRRLSCAISPMAKKAPPPGPGPNFSPTFSPTQSVLNITWALRRLRSLNSPLERRTHLAEVRKRSPFRIPDMYLLPFVDLVAMEEIPRRTGDRFLGHPSRRPMTCTEVASRAEKCGFTPVVVYVSHRWLEPDFKNPDDHSKSRFYQVCYLVHLLAKRMSRKSCEFYLWIDYACINQLDPSADRLALAYVLDACDVMVYIEDDEYWEQALSRTEHFLFHKLRALRVPLRGVLGNDDVFSLSTDGEKLTQRTFVETKGRFSHIPAKGALATETDRLYLWTLVLALEYEVYDGEIAIDPAAAEVNSGVLKILRSALTVSRPRDQKKAAPSEAASVPTSAAGVKPEAASDGADGAGQGARNPLGSLSELDAGRAEDVGDSTEADDDDDDDDDDDGVDDADDVGDTTSVQDAYATSEDSESSGASDVEVFHVEEKGDRQRGDEDRRGDPGVARVEGWVNAPPSQDEKLKLAWSQPSPAIEGTRGR